MKIGLFYKNFAAHAGISHIGLGVAALKNAEYLILYGGYDAVVVAAKNNIDIVEAIRKYGFTHVIISAPWLSALDVDTMVRHFKDVKFAIISHSNIGFLQADGGALQLLRKYALISKEVPNLFIGGNSLIFARWFSDVYDTPALALPNLYEVGEPVPGKPMESIIKIGSFGAIRPQKNVMTSAASAMLVARFLGKPVQFHVSTGREDGGGGTILNAIRQMMGQVPGIELIERNWSNWMEFKQSIREMDLLFQMSYTESFNMVTADGISQGVPSVTSNAITWVPGDWVAKADDVFSVMRVAERLLHHRNKAVSEGRDSLTKRNIDSFVLWQQFLGGS
jgi:hypothetical protein